MLEVSRQGKKVLITVDESMISNAFFLKFLERMKVEDIAQKSKLEEPEANFIANAMKNEWWTKNKKNCYKYHDEIKNIIKC